LENVTLKGGSCKKRKLKDNAFPTIFIFSKKAKFSSLNNLPSVTEEQCRTIAHDHRYSKTAVGDDFLSQSRADDVEDMDVAQNGMIIDEISDPIPSCSSSNGPSILTSEEVDRTLVDFEILSEMLNDSNSQVGDLQQKNSRLESLLSQLVNPDQLESMGSKWSYEME
jgi:hypothetical protein